MSAPRKAHSASSSTTNRSTTTSTPPLSLPIRCSPTLKHSRNDTSISHSSDNGRKKTRKTTSLRRPRNRKNELFYAQNVRGTCVPQFVDFLIFKKKHNRAMHRIFLHRTIFLQKKAFNSCKYVSAYKSISCMLKTLLTN